MISPNSRYIEQQLSEIKNRKDKNTFLESIMSDPTATILHEVNGHRTIIFRGNKGPKTTTWEQTKRMAFDLNNKGIAVAFLLELIFDTSADSLIKSGNVYRIADFKYCVTTKTNTLSKDLEHGFEQANTIILKLENMDSGIFKDAIDYLLRNEIPYGNIILINRYSDVLEIPRKELKTGIYKKKIKGFL